MTLEGLTQLLTAVQAAQTFGHAGARLALYGTIFRSLTPEQLVIVAMVLAEGNAFGPDAARSLAQVVAL